MALYLSSRPHSPIRTAPRVSDRPDKVPRGMLGDGSPHARDQLRRSRSRSRGRAEWPGGPRDDGPGRLAPSPYAGPPPVRPVHPRERGDWQPPPEAWPGFADPQRPPREWERAELRGERSDPMLGVRRGFGHDEDFSSIHPSRGPPRRAEDVHLPEREGRGRLDHGFEEGKGRSGRDLNEPRSKDVRVPASRRVGDLRGDVRMPGGKGYDYAVVLCVLDLLGLAAEGHNRPGGTGRRVFAC